jgi:hypothetical protein
VAVPVSGHVKPALQARQAAGDALSDAPVYVPAGHGVAAALPASANVPGPAAAPTTPSTGVGVAAPPKHT